MEQESEKKQHLHRECVFSVLMCVRVLLKLK